LNPLLLFSEQPLRRDSDVLEKELRLIRAALVKRLDRPALGYALSVSVDQEEAHPVGTALRISLAHYEQHRAEGPIGDPDLVAIDDVVAAVLARIGAEIRHVAAGLGLGEASLRNHFAACIARQPFPLLLFGSPL